MEINQTLYEILGIEQDADLDTIKRAYRKMVQIYHPDKAGQSPENTDRFAQICKAYEILSDPEKRALYDKPRRSRTFYRSSWRPPKGANFSGDQPHTEGFTQKTNKRNPSWRQPQNSLNLDDLFGGSDESPKSNPTSQEQFGRRYAQNQARAGERTDGEDIHVEVNVPTSTALKGGMVQFEYRRTRRTDGLDVQSVLELFYLRVPKNTREGEVLDIEKMGHTGVNGGRSGDLHCTVRLVLENPIQQERGSSNNRSDNNQFESKRFTPNTTPNTKKEATGVVQITFPEAVLGGRVQVVTPKGEVVVSIPAGTSSGRRLRIKEKGADDGDYIVTVHIVVPTDLDAESVRLIQEFADRNPLSPR